MKSDPRAINELYELSKERCSFLISNDAYRDKIVSDCREEVFRKGYFQGYYDALIVISDHKNNGYPWVSFGYLGYRLISLFIGKQVGKKAVNQVIISDIDR